VSAYRAGRGDVLAKVVFALIILVIFVVAIGIRLAITGGDVGCAFAQDPALCVAVKGVR